MAKVLVIEDNPVNMKLAMLLLHNAGHVVLSAIDAESGLALMSAERPDLILMDFQLPGMDGLAATTLLKKNPATALIPVILLTAAAMHSNPGLELGCDAFIEKPLRYQELKGAIDTLLAQGRIPAPSNMTSVNLGEQGAPLVASASCPGVVLSQVDGVRAVDVTVLEKLIGSDPSVISEFLESFQINAEKIAQKLKQACTARQSIKVGKLAHMLKSSAYIVGAWPLAELCGEVETAAKADSAEMLSELLPRFEQELDAVNRALTFLQNRFVDE